MTLTSIVRRFRARAVEPRAARTAIPTAELVECCCPDWCERDHGAE
jgi:hypothetical protein